MRRFASADLEGLGTLLAERFQFSGPLLQAASRDDYIEALRRDPPEACDVRIVDVEAHEGEATVHYELEKSGGTIGIEQWFEVRGGRVLRSRVAFREVTG